MTGAGTYHGVLPSGLVEQPVGVDLTRTAEELAISALGASPHRARFPLHGAWAVAAWVGGRPRPTQGIDLLDQEHGSLEDVVAALHAGLGWSCGGLSLDWSGMRVRTKAKRHSPLHRISIPARLGRRQLDLRVDVTAARVAHSNTEFRLLHRTVADLKPILAACCGVNDLVAEKTALLVTYGADHTRLQDIFDLWLLMTQLRFDGDALINAILGTFAGRDAARMIRRTDGYWQAAFEPSFKGEAALARWAKLLATTRPDTRPPNLGTALRAVAGFLCPLLLATRGDTMAPGHGVPIPDGCLSRQSLLAATAP